MPELKHQSRPLEDRAFYGLIWAGNQLTHQVEQQLKRRHDLPVSWFEVLLWLADQEEPISVSDLGSCTMLSRSQVSRVLDSLHARGLITRTPSETDARAVQVQLTGTGQELFRQADATRRECLLPVFTDVLDERDREDLVRVLRKLHDAAQ